MSRTHRIFDSVTASFFLVNNPIVDCVFGIADMIDLSKLPCSVSHD